MKPYAALIIVFLTGCNHPKISLEPIPPAPFIPYIYSMLPPVELERQKAEMRRLKGLNNPPPTPFLNRAAVMQYVPAQAATVPLPLPGGTPDTYPRDHIAEMKRAWLNRASSQPIRP